MGPVDISSVSMMDGNVVLIIEGSLAFYESSVNGERGLKLLEFYSAGVDDNGFIAFISPIIEVPTIYEEVERLKLDPGQFLVPSFIDCHVHAPQYSYTGTATDKPLMEWLNTYTFPAEARLKDIDTATDVYTKLVSRLLNNGTTTAMYFATKDLASCKQLMKICEFFGQRALIGKVSMDRHVPE